RESHAIVNGEHWEEIFQEAGHAEFERILLKYVSGQRWFCGAGRGIKAVQIQERVVLPASPTRIHLLGIFVEYTEGDPEEYLLPLGFATGPEREHIEQTLPQ